MGFVKSSIVRWSTLKVFKHWVKPLKIKNYALNKSKICLISFLKPQLGKTGWSYNLIIPCHFLSNTKYMYFRWGLFYGTERNGTERNGMMD